MGFITTFTFMYITHFIFTLLLFSVLLFPFHSTDPSPPNQSLFYFHIISLSSPVGGRGECRHAFLPMSLIRITFRNVDEGLFRLWTTKLVTVLPKKSINQVLYANIQDWLEVFYFDSKGLFIFVSVSHCFKYFYGLQILLILIGISPILIQIFF